MMIVKKLLPMASQRDTSIVNGGLNPQIFVVTDYANDPDSHSADTTMLPYLV